MSEIKTIQAAVPLDFANQFKSRAVLMGMSQQDALHEAAKDWMFKTDPIRPRGKFSELVQEVGDYLGKKAQEMQAYAEELRNAKCD